MSTLKVANVHLETTGANRIDYLNDSIIRLTSGAALLPVGGNASRPTGTPGLIRYNSDSGSFEGYNASAWGTIGGGSTGSGVSKFTSNIGNSSANTFNITHSLGTTSVVPSVREYSTNYIVYPDIKITTPNHVVLEFVDAPTANQYLLLVIG